MARNYETKLMTNILNRLIAFVFVALVFPYQGSGRDGLSDTLRFEVHRVYPYVSITRKELKEANTLSELNGHYQASWVKEYISVEVTTSYQGRKRKAVGKNDTLTPDQKDMIHVADAGTDISVRVMYLPDNSLKHNDIKEFQFSFTVDPEREASYTGGQQQLMRYLKDKAISNIPQEDFEKSTLAAVKFTIDEIGQIIDAHIFETSKDKNIDALLLETICNMPEWEPAEYSNGTRVRQEFVLTVGNMESCVINLLSIRQD